MAEPPPGTSNKGPYCPSACRWLEIMPRPDFSSAWSTTAPAPSPKRTQVVRSCQLTILDNISAPTTRMFFAFPPRMKPSATAIPYKKPLQTALRSKAAQPPAPSLCCRMQAVGGKTMSGVTVATMIMSRSDGLMPAMSSARQAAV